MPLVPGTVLGPYEIKSALGAGGMGEVYRAIDTRLGRPVAIKVLPEHVGADPSLRQRFEREARTISRLNHPNICTLYDIGEHDGRPFIVMEVVGGETLALRLAAGPLAAAQAIELGIQLADALDAAHTEGVIHRDIKPANIIVTEQGRAKLLDFGVAKLAPAAEPGTDLEDRFSAPTVEAVQLTTPRSAIGTVAYMSPEQARGENLDQRTDLFSLGAVLYEMVTAQRAFSGNTTAVVFEAILNRAPVAPVHFAPTVPPRLGEIINNALEKNPELRYQSAADLKADLKRLRRDLESGWSSVTSAAGVETTLQVSGIASSAGRSRASSRVAAPFPASGTGARAQDDMRRSPAIWSVGAAIAVLVLLAAAWLGPWRARPPQPTAAASLAAAEAVVQSELALATDGLARNEYEAAIAHAETALATAPGHPEALRIRAAAAAALGRNRAAPEPDEVVEPVPAVAAPRAPAPVAPRAEAPRPETPRSAVTEPALEPEPLPQAEVASPPPAVADLPAPTQPVVPPVDVPTVPPVASAPADEPGGDAEEAEEESAAVSDEVPDEVPDPVPPSVAEEPAETAQAPSDEVAIRDVLETLARAIEGQDMALYRSVRPGLSADEESRVRAAFDAVESQRVDLRVLSITLRGDEALVSLSRRDTVRIDGQEQTRESAQTVTLTRAAGGWVITRMGG